MATSATSTYNPTAQTIIDLALKDIGTTGPGDEADPNLRAHALTVLNIVIKSLDAMGVFTWKVTRRTLTLTAGTSNYALANDVSDIDQPCRYVQSGLTQGSLVMAISRDDYMAIPDRTLTAPSMQYYVEKGLDATGIEFITLYLYPAPQATGDTLEYPAVIRIKDLNTLNDTLDVPQKWVQAIRWGLTANLAPSYGVDPGTVSMFNKRHQDALDTAFEDDNERGDMTVVPFGSSYGYGSYRSYGGR